MHDIATIVKMNEKKVMEAKEKREEEAQYWANYFNLPPVK